MKMTQKFLQGGWKYSLAGALVIGGAIALCGRYASATFRLQPPTGNLLHLESITSDAPASNIYVRIKNTGDRSDVYTLDSGKPVPLNISSCFNNIVTVQLVSLNSRNEQIIGEHTVQISQSPSPIVFQGKDNGVHYTMNYEVLPSYCRRD